MHKLTPFLFLLIASSVTHLAAQKVIRETDSIYTRFTTITRNHPDQIDPKELSGLSAAFFENESVLENNHLEMWIDDLYSFGVKAYSYDPEITVLVLRDLAQFDWKSDKDSINDRLGRIFNLLGLAHKKLQRTNESLEALSMALVYFSRCKHLDPAILPGLYINIGNANRQMGDYSKALDYLNQGEALCKSALVEPGLESITRTTLQTRLISILVNKGIALAKMDHYPDAIPCFHEAENLAKRSNTLEFPIIYSNLGVSYEAVGDFDQASLYNKLAISAAEKSDDQETYINSSVNLLSIYSKTGQQQEFYQRVTKIRSMIAQQEENPFYLKILATTYVQEAALKEKDADFLKSKQMLHRALGTVQAGLFKADSSDLIRADKISGDAFFVVDIMTLIAAVQVRSALQTESESMMEVALQQLNEADKLIDSLRNNLSTQESKIILNQQQKEVYREQADICMRLYEWTGNENYIDRLFTACEKGKTAGLWSEIQQTNLKSAYIPEDLLDLEGKIKDEMTQVQNQISDFRKPGLTQSEEPEAYIKELEQRRFELSTRLDSLLQIYNQTYPEYYNLKFNNKTIETSELQKMLGKEHVFIQFYLTNDYIHQIIISDTSLLHRAISHPEKKMADLDHLLNTLKATRLDYSKEDSRHFEILAHQLYDDFFAPIQKYIRNKKLIISPDDRMNLFPFEVLVQNYDSSAQKDFRNFDYMILDYQISYTYTATLWAYHDENIHLTEKPGRVLAFAPYYDKTSGVVIWEDGLGERFPELPGTLEEVRKIRKNFKSKSFTEDRATEDHFKKQLHNGTILHLAMHTVIDNDEPLNSYLVFYPDPNGIEDGRLTASEILNYRLNTQLTVLSACNTGSGKVREGEGIMGLARSFIQAGSPGLLLNLWTMDDRSGQKIIGRFYDLLKDGYSTAEALQAAKTDYLKSSKKLTAHPHYWAGIVLHGTDSSPRLNKKYDFIAVVAIIILIGVLLLFILRKQKQELTK